MVATLFLASVALEIFLVVLVFLTSQALIGELPTKHVSRERVSGFDLPGILYFDWSVPLKTL